MKMWKLSHTYVCDCGETQAMSHFITCDDAPNCTWAYLVIQTLPVSTVPNTGRNLSNTNYRGLDVEDEVSKTLLVKKNSSASAHDATPALMC